MTHSPSNRRCSDPRMTLPPPICSARAFSAARRGGTAAVGLLGHAPERGGEERGGGVGGDVDEPVVLARAGNQVGRDRLTASGDRAGEAPGVPVTAQFVFVAD